jgi:hypothetical protein
MTIFKQLILAGAAALAFAGTAHAQVPSFTSPPECQALVTQMLDDTSHGHLWGIDPMNGGPIVGSDFTTLYRMQVSLIGALIAAKVSQVYPALPAGDACDQIARGKLEFVKVMP